MITDASFDLLKCLNSYVLFYLVNFAMFIYFYKVELIFKCETFTKKEKRTITSRTKSESNNIRTQNNTVLPMRCKSMVVQRLRKRLILRKFLMIYTILQVLTAKPSPL